MKIKKDKILPFLLILNAILVLLVGLYHFLATNNSAMGIKAVVIGYILLLAGCGYKIIIYAIKALVEKVIGLIWGIAAIKEVKSFLKQKTPHKQRID